MQVVGTTMVTPEVFRAVLKVMLGRTLLTCRLLGLLIVVAGLLIVFLDPTNDLIPGLGFVVIGLAFAVVLPWRTIRLSIRRNAPGLAAPWRYEIDENVIRVATPIATSDWPWANMRTFAEHAEFWLVGTPIKRHFVIVVKAAFSPADQQAVAELGRRKLAGSPVA